MKTIAKSLSPNELTTFAGLFPNGSWDPDFRDYAVPPNSAGHDYKQIKKRIVVDQGGLCAYCERPLRELGPTLQRVEHYHPKSDTSVPGVNWGLLWSNVIVVCTGGENDDKNLYPRPTNLSCDAYKNHWLGALKLKPAALLTLLGSLQNPLTLLPFPCPFGFDRQTGKLLVDGTVCSAIDTALNLQAGTTFAIIDRTINTALNLNCDRLCADRREVLFQYNRELTRARAENLTAENFKKMMALKWFGKKWPSFFTTRRILLGQFAEIQLSAAGYVG